MSTPPFAALSLIRARDLVSGARGNSRGQPWDFGNLKGRLIELSECAPRGATSFCGELILDAQREGEPCVWVASGASVFYPPDFADLGIDLSCLQVVWTKGLMNSLQATEWLVHSGSFGLVVVDLGPHWQADDALLGRVQRLCEHHGSAVVFLTRKNAGDPSMGSSISRRAVVTRSGSDTFVSEITITKDKRERPGMQTRKTYHGPPGMY